MLDEEIGGLKEALLVTDIEVGGKGVDDGSYPRPAEHGNKSINDEDDDDESDGFVKDDGGDDDEYHLLDVGWIESILSLNVPYRRPDFCTSPNMNELTLDWSNFSTTMVKMIAKELVKRSCQNNDDKKKKKLARLNIESKVEDEEKSNLLKIGLKHIIQRKQQEYPQQQPQPITLDVSTLNKSLSLLNVILDCNVELEKLVLRGEGSTFENEFALTRIISSKQDQLLELEIVGPYKKAWAIQQPWDVHGFSNQLDRLLGSFPIDSKVKSITFWYPEILITLFEKLPMHLSTYRNLQSLSLRIHTVVGNPNNDTTVTAAANVDWNVLLRQPHSRLSELHLFGYAVDSFCHSVVSTQNHPSPQHLKKLVLDAWPASLSPTLTNDLPALIELNVLPSVEEIIVNMTTEDGQYQPDIGLPLALAKALRNNTTLRRFEVKSLDPNNGLTKRILCKQFAKTIESNRTLEHLQFLRPYQFDEELGIIVLQALSANQTLHSMFPSQLPWNRDSSRDEILTTIKSVLDCNKVKDFDLKREILSSVAVAADSGMSTSLVTNSNDIPITTATAVMTAASRTTATPPTCLPSTTTGSSEQEKQLVVDGQTCSSCSKYSCEEKMIHCSRCCGAHICSRCVETYLVEEGYLGEKYMRCPNCHSKDMLSISKDLYGFVSAFHYQSHCEALFRKKYSLETL